MLTKLKWLPTPPATFRQDVRALRQELEQGRDVEEALIALATHALDTDQLEQLAKMAKLLAGRDKLQRLASVRLGLVGAGTLGFAANAITASALRHRVLATVVLGEYGSVMQEAFDPEAAIRTTKLDLLLVAPDYRMLGLDRAVVGKAEAEARLDAAMATLRTIVDGLRSAAPGGVMIQTVVPPVEPLFGNFDLIDPGSCYNLVMTLNLRIARWAEEQKLILVDVARVASWAGLERWDDPGLWHSAKLPFGLGSLPLYADVIARVLAAVRGKTRKALVLDLDNTLWGGVIGDDGVDGIRLGQGSASGEAFLAIQRMALELRARGVVLAVCSKNEDAAARLPFRNHPDMLLKEEHIAVFHANWTDKASNLRAIAETLNIGLDALVFLDDNPAERAIVRRELPMVAVPEVGDEPALYPRVLACAGYFEAVTVVDEDRKRADAYKANAERQALASSSDLAGYLSSLDMTCDIRPFDSVGRARIAQLANKSNQFNLTTRRYTEAEIAAAEADSNRLTVQVRLADRFGDNGMISVVIFVKGHETWEAETWLMSCRVLGRRVEEAVLAHVARAARAAGARALVGRYIPTEKNRMVADHYGKLGFALVESSAEKGSVWRLDLDTYTEPELPMRITFARDEAA